MLFHLIKMSKLKEYKFLKEIGEGNFGKVYLVKKISDNLLYVAKKINLLNLDPDEGNKYLKNERTITSMLNHKNVVHLYDYFEENNCAFFIMEYCNGKSLANTLKINKEQGKTLTQAIIQFFFKQIVEGLNHIHSKGIIHRDIKLENILLNFKNNNTYNYKESEIKIIDFGLSSLGPASSLVGSPIYMDPKIIEKYERAGGIDELNKYDEKADIWSLGAICYEMITGENLFKAKNMEELKKEEKKGIYYLDLKLDLSTEIISFLNAMLQYEPEIRSSTEELLKHPFLNKNVKDFTPLNFDGITYKIENGIFKINFIKNETLIKKFNKDIAEKLKMRKQNSKEEENTIEINSSLLSNKINKQNVFLKKYMNDLSMDYNKARLYFKDNNLDTQEKDASKKIVFIEKMKENLSLQRPVDIKDLPKKINPEYIYGCSYKERNEKFIQIIREYKNKKNKYKNLDENKLKNLEYIILLLEQSYTNEWTPPPKLSYKKNLIQHSNRKIYQIKFIIERKDNLNIDFNFNISLVVNPNKTLKK